MGRLAHDVAWGIEKRKKIEGGDGESSILSVGRMKKEMEEEKNRADAEKRMKEEEQKKREDSERRMEKEKMKRETVEREKRELEERLHRFEVEEQKKREEEERRRKEEEEKRRHITSLDAFAGEGIVLRYTNPSRFTRSHNTITHSGENYNETIILGRAPNSV